MTKHEVISMKIRPLQDRLVVRRVEEQERTRGGIIIPDTAKERPLEGEVTAVGAGKKLEDGTVVALDVKKGLLATIEGTCRGRIEDSAKRIPGYTFHVRIEGCKVLNVEVAK